MTRFQRISTISYVNNRSSSNVFAHLKNEMQKKLTQRFEVASYNGHVCSLKYPLIGYVRYSDPSTSLGKKFIFLQMWEVVRRYNVCSAEWTISLLLEPRTDTELVELVSTRIQRHQDRPEIVIKVGI